MKPELLAAIRTYDPRVDTSTGYDVEFWRKPGDSAYAILRYHSNWQRDPDGATYRVIPPEPVLKALDQHVDDQVEEHWPDLETAVENWIVGSRDDDWLLIRKGRRAL